MGRCVSSMWVEADGRCPNLAVPGSDVCVLHGAVIPGGDRSPGWPEAEGLDPLVVEVLEAVAEAADVVPAPPAEGEG